MSKVSFSSQSRLFHLVLYPDSTTYSTTNLLSEFVATDKNVVEVCYCLHDKDVKDEVDLKPHYHVVFRFKNPIQYQTLLNRYSLPASCVNLPDTSSKGSQSFRRMVRYLIHADSPKKYQYDLSSIVSNFDINQFFDQASSDLQSSAFLDLLDAVSTKGASRRSVALYATSSGLLSYYRLFYHILWDVVKDDDIVNPQLLTRIENLEKLLDIENQPW